MKKMKALGFFVLLILILFWPAAAQPQLTTTFTCPQRACIDQEFECIVTASYEGFDGPYVQIGNWYPNFFNPGSVTNVQPSPPGIDYPSFPVAQWDYLSVNNGWSTDLTVKMTPVKSGELRNSLWAHFWNGETWQDADFITVYTTVSDTCPNPAPEFPSIALPATVITGFIAVVLYMRRTREN